MNFIKRWLANNRDYRLLQSIKQSVDARITYKDTGKNEWLYVKPGTHADADCQAYCQTYMVDCQNAGYKAERFVFKLPDGTPHAHCIVTTDTAVWVLDCRNKTPVKA